MERISLKVRDRKIVTILMAAALRMMILKARRAEQRSGPSVRGPGKLTSGIISRMLDHISLLVYS